MAEIIYSNLGYLLLGEIVARVSGLPYERYVNERILAPLAISPADLGFDIGAATQTPKCASTRASAAAMSEAVMGGTRKGRDAGIGQLAWLGPARLDFWSRWGGGRRRRG